MAISTWRKNEDDDDNDDEERKIQSKSNNGPSFKHNNKRLVYFIELKNRNKEKNKREKKMVKIGK